VIHKKAAGGNKPKGYIGGFRPGDATKPAKDDKWIITLQDALDPHPPILEQLDVKDVRRIHLI